MKAAQIKEYGDASVVKISEVDKPSAQEGQVLVEVHASSINPFDSAVRSGYMQEMIPLDFPITLGGDISGVVVEVGQGVDSVAVGDKVFGQANAVTGSSGAFAEFAATSAEQVAKMPTNADCKEAASLPLVGVSALQALNDHIKLKKGQKILITGGTGGIGTIAIQIAKHIGANVTATASGDGLAVVKQLGADEAVDYKSVDIAEALSDFDAVFDTASSGDFDKALRVLKKGGTAVSMIAQPNEVLAAELSVTAMNQLTQINTDKLTELAKLVEEGVVKPQVKTTYSLDDIVEAFGAKENGDIIGKIAVKVKR